MIIPVPLVDAESIYDPELMKQLLAVLQEGEVAA